MLNWHVKTIVKPLAYQRTIASRTNMSLATTGKHRAPGARHSCQMCHPIAPEHCSEFTTTLLALNLNINPIPVTKLHGFSLEISVTPRIFSPNTLLEFGEFPNGNKYVCEEKKMCYNKLERMNYILNELYLLL